MEYTKMTWRQWLLVNGVSLASRAAPAFVGRKAFDVFCTPPRKGVPTPGERKLAERVAPTMAQATPHTIATPSGQVMAHLWQPHDGVAGRGRVLLVHGWTGRAAVMAAFVEPLRSAGFGVVALDLPGHGDSSGNRLNLAIGARAVHAVERALGPFTAAVTHSFGGPVTLLAAEGGSPLDRAMPLSKIVMISAPNRLDHITQQFADAVGLGAQARIAMDGEVLRIAGRPMAAYRCDDFLRRTGIPALIIHDADDLEVPLANGEAIAAAAPNAQLVTTHRLGHRRIIFAPSVIAQSVAFLAGDGQDLAVNATASQTA
jgi:pimeloyl-ACP methyl ester carboxylesterase